MAVALVCGSVAAASAEKPAADETPQEVGPAAYSDVIGDVILQGNSYFARYEGIDGEATDEEHEDWINILCVDWGASLPIAGVSGISTRRGTPDIEDFEISFLYDKSAPRLLKRCLTGSVTPRLEIELTMPAGEGRATYLRYELTNVLITSYSVSGQADGVPVVTLANNFEKIKVTYTEFDENGASLGDTEFTYNVETGRPE